MIAMLRLVTSAATGFWRSGVLALALFANARAATAATHDLPALRAPLAAEALLLDLTRAGDRLVAVGAQGVIITSDDNAHTWTQSAVPVSAQLNGVSFADAQHGWAVGHGGVVLRSDDAGATWVRVALTDAADASFLDVLALTPGEVLVCGAYGAFFVTRDAGVTWQTLPPPEEDLHLNRLTRGASGPLYLAGEMGTLATSTDAGATWSALESPYDGSFYGLRELASGRLLAHGLRGHVFISDDAGESWTPVAISEPVLIMSAWELKPGTVVLGALGGHLYTSTDGATNFQHTQPAGLGSVAEVNAAPDGSLVAVGEKGVQRVGVLR